MCCLYTRILLAGRRAAVPLWPVVCPMPQGGGAVIGLCHADVALGSALDSAEALWHLSPERSEGRQYAPQLTRRLRPPAARADITEERRQIRSCTVLQGMKSPRCRKAPGASRIIHCEWMLCVGGSAGQACCAGAERGTAYFSQLPLTLRSVYVVWSSLCAR